VVLETGPAFPSSSGARGSYATATCAPAKGRFRDGALHTDEQRAVARMVEGWRAGEPYLNRSGLTSRTVLDRRLGAGTAVLPADRRAVVLWADCYGQRPQELHEPDETVERSRSAITR
jgi:hypothetical protein